MNFFWLTYKKWRVSVILRACDSRSISDRTQQILKTCLLMRLATVYWMSPMC